MQKQQNQAPTGGPSGFTKIGKWVLIGLNVAVFVLGIVSLAIGAWSVNDDYGADNIEVIMETDLYTAGSVILIVGGVVVILTAVLGVLGALFNSRLMLGIYFGIMIFFGLLFVVGVILAFFFLGEVEESLANKMEETLKKKYYVDIDTNEENNDVTTVWNDIQKQLKCCGVRGGLTGSQSWFLWQSSQWYQSEGIAVNPANSIYVPSSCCNTKYLHDECQLANGANTQPPQTSVAGITDENPALYHTGCLDALEDKINDHIAGIVTVAILIFLLIVVCSILSMLVLMEASRVGHVV